MDKKKEATKKARQSRHQQMLERKNRAIELHSAGMRVTDIAREIGVTRKVIYDYLKDAPVPETEDFRAWMRAKDAQVLELEQALQQSTDYFQTLVLRIDELEKASLMVNQTLNKTEGHQRTINSMLDRITAIEGSAGRTAKAVAEEMMRNHSIAFYGMRSAIQKWMERMGIEKYPDEGERTVFDQIEDIQGFMNRAGASLDMHQQRLDEHNGLIGKYREVVSDLERQVHNQETNILGLMETLQGVKETVNKMVDLVREHAEAPAPSKSDDLRFWLQELTNLFGAGKSSVEGDVEKLKGQMEDLMKLVKDLAEKDRERVAQEFTQGLRGSHVVAPPGLRQDEAYNFGWGFGEHFAPWAKALFELDKSEASDLTYTLMDAREILQKAMRRTEEKKEARMPVTPTKPATHPDPEPGEPEDESPTDSGHEV